MLAARAAGMQATGVYLVRVNRFEHDTQVEQEYIDTQFLAHAHQCYEAAQVELATKG
jgi:hypothetical protein